MRRGRKGKGKRRGKKENVEGEKEGKRRERE